MEMLDKAQPDLSLDELRFLVTLFETQSLTQAASSRGLSMGAASRRLSALREAFQDELFVRSGLQMLPTARMRAMLPKVLNLLSLSQSLFSSDAFDLANTRRTVRILGVDNAVMTILREAIGRFAKDAPNATIEIRAIDSQMFELLRTGRADIAIYPLKTVPKDFHVVELYHSRRGILVRKGHPLIDLYNKKGFISAEDLHPYRKVEMNHAGAPDFGPAVDPPQEVGISMPYFLAVPYALMETDFTYIAPVLTLLNFLRDDRYELRMLPAPQQMSAFTPSVVWHKGTHSDPFLQWVRGVIVGSARAEARRLGVVEEPEI
ncbi:LysR family transcriptional regulator [Sutterella seckii]|uniref:LysR family transcriptional regulator n=1 Tax=Sutterella seckii TaxID=1944635 RepID=A0AAI9WMB6_9BURK|nr:LysR family transcriptional regulator [Sutterella seckii]KAB7649975.1 LysR family transcriptional regulator [Sutterella seckii]